MSQNLNYILIEKVLSKSASEKELDDFNKWLQLSEENELAYNEIKQIWEKYANIQVNDIFNNQEGLNAVRNKIIRNKEIEKRKRTLKFWISAAASIVILLGLFKIMSITNSRNLETYTSYEKIEKVILADSSIVWLNKNSTLKIGNRYNKNKRRVFLSGEAYFEITRDETKSFEVIAGKTITKVLGTSFNILEKTPENNTVITVNSGKVAFKKFRSMNKATILTKNEKATYLDETNTINKQLNSNLNYLSWKSNYLIFQDTPLHDVCEQLSKHFNKKIIQRTSDSNLYLTGKYEGESLGEILNIIEITFNIHVDSSANAYTFKDVSMN